MLPLYLHVNQKSDYDDIYDVSIGDNLHEMSECFTGKKKIKKNISVCHQLKILPRQLALKYLNIMWTGLLLSINFKLVA